MSRAWFTLSVLLLYGSWAETSGAAGETGARRSLEVTRVSGHSISVDGHASEAEWTLADRQGQFVQSDPHEGAAPTEETFVRAVRDDDALYFFVEVRYRDPEDVRGLLTQRDLWSTSDWIEVVIDPQNDSQTGYRLAVSARGVQLDARLSKAGEVQDTNWDGVWNSAVAQTSYGWSAEIRVPFSQLRYSPLATEFGVQFARFLARESEWSQFSPVPKSTTRPLLHLARLEKLQGLPQSGGLSLRPYGLFRLQETRHASLWEPQFGGDLLYQPNGGTMVQGTVLPDFGQVEQDPSQLNLTAFEIFQSERRQFFLDGQENLLTPLAFNNGQQEHLYYSRRIGARPTIDFGLSPSDASPYPNQTMILGATKVLSRSQSGLSASLLSAVTSRETATFETDGALERHVVAAPTSYSVGRVVKQVQGGRGAVGVSGTHVERFLTEELEGEQVRRATSGATDFDVRFGDLGLKGQVAGSHLEGSRDAIDRVQRSTTNNLKRVDAAHLDYDPERTDLSGYSLALQGGKFDGGPWRASWGGRLRSPGLNTNDLGFLRLADQEQAEAFLQYRFDKPNRLIRRATVETSSWFEKTWGPEITSAGSQVSGSFQLLGNAYGWAGINRRAATLDTRVLRGGPALLLPGGSGMWMGIHSDPRKSADYELAFDGDLLNQNSFRRFGITLQGFFRPTGAIDFSLAPRFETKVDDRQYVDTLAEASGSSYYLGRLHQETYTLTLRASWALALGLTLRFYAMPFVSAGRYERYYRVTEPKAQEYEARREQADYDGDDSFLSSQIRSSLVLRWDFLAGSSAYAVWTHDQGTWRSDAGSVQPLRDIQFLFESPPTDVVMLKWGYFIPL